MNPTCPEELILQSFSAALAAAYPARIVTRTLQDFSDRKKTDLAAGVYTVLANGLPAGDLFEQKLRFIVVGQIEFPEKTLGEVVEAAELAMSREIRTLLQRQLRGPDMRVLGVEQSAQLEVPYGWVSVSIEAGPYDGTEPLTADEAIGNLADFLSFKADIDVAQPHQGAAEHQKWVADTPDYSTSQPDAQLDVQIPRSTP